MKEFKNEEIGAGVVLENTAYRRIVEIVSERTCSETGGILIGYYDVTHQYAIITEATNAPKDSKAGATWFLRGVFGLRKILQDKWRRKEEFYLGEWHLHPKSRPFPSFTDIKQMKQIAKDKRYKCKEPLLLIVGEKSGILEMSMTLIIGDKIYEMNEVTQ